MTYTDALKRGDTRGQFRAAERLRREMTYCLLEGMKVDGLMSGRKAERLKREAGVSDVRPRT